MEENSPAGETARRAAGDFLATFGEQFASIGVQLGVRYDGSPILVEDGAPPADDYLRYAPSGVPGGRAPHLWLEDASGKRDSLFDRFGSGFTFLRLTQSAPDTGPVVAAAQARGVPLRTLDVADPDARELYGRDLALIRPDQHICWRGNRLPGDCDALLARITGY
jgi:hypothetical protein